MRPLHVIWMILVAFLILFSCKKESEEENSIVNHLEVNASVTRLVYFPYDSISLTFLIEATNGTPPYNHHWINPPGFTGAGPFTIDVESDTTLEVEVSDAGNEKINYLYEVRKDTIDPLKYDYRDLYAGRYGCTVVYKWYVEDSTGAMHFYDTTYLDTLTVLKDPLFNYLKIAKFQPLKYYVGGVYFMTGNTSATLRNDSIYLYSFYTPLALYSWSYRGKKMKE